MVSSLHVCFNLCWYSNNSIGGKHFWFLKIVVKLKKKSTPEPVSKHWMLFSYIRSEDYELDKNFDDTEFKRQSDNTPNGTVKLFCETVVVIKE